MWQTPDTDCCGLFLGFSTTNIRCKNCTPEDQCSKCKKVTTHTHEWGECPCGQPNSVEHTMDKRLRVAHTRSMLQNFLRRTVLTQEQRRQQPPQHFFDCESTLGNIKFSKEARRAHTGLKLANKANECIHHHRNACEQQVWLPHQTTWPPKQTIQHVQNPKNRGSPHPKTFPLFPLSQIT